MEQVTRSLRSSSTPRSDQGRIWESISDKAERTASYSDAGAMADIYEQQKVKLKEYTSAFAPQDFQVGAVFAINASVVGADLCDAPETFRKFMRMLIESYAMDAIEGGVDADATIAARQVKQFVADMDAAVAERFPPVGEGEDLRLSSKDLAGAALIAEGRVVHLAAFRIEPAAAGAAPTVDRRMRSRRRRNSE